LQVRVLEPTATEAGGPAVPRIAALVLLVQVAFHPLGVTTVTPPYWRYDNPLHAILAEDPDLDVLGFNFYSYGTRDIERKCDNAKSLLVQAYNPLLVMEAGLVGMGQTYPEAINLASKVPSTYTGSPNGPGW
jgi:hypothetical protein